MAINLPKASDFATPDQLDTLLEQTEQQLVQCKKNIASIHSAMADTKRRHGVRAKAGTYQQKLNEYLKHQQAVEQHQPEYDEAASKLNKHRKSIELAPEWNQWMRASQKSKPIYLTYNELDSLKKKLDSELDWLNKCWDRIVEHQSLVDKRAQLTSEISALECDSQQLYHERVVNQKKQQSTILLDRKILQNRNNIELLEHQIVLLDEELNNDEHFFDSDKVPLVDAEFKHAVLTRKYELIKQQTRQMPSLHLDKLPGEYRTPRVSIDQAHKEWLRALKYSEVNSETEFLQAILSPEKIQELRLICDEYMKKSISIAEKVWIMTDIVNLEQALCEQTQRLQDLSQYYAALERIYRHKFRDVVCALS